MQVTFDSYKNFKGYVINLDRERWRYDETESKLKQLGFTNISRWKATDYKEEDVVAEMRRMGGLHLERFVNDAEIALVLGHYRVWLDFLSGNDAYCLVFEDDAVGVDNFKDVADFKDLNYGEFDLLMLGGIFLDLTTAEGERSFLSLQQAVKVQGNRTYLKGASFWQSHAYLLSRKGAHKAISTYVDWLNADKIIQPQVDNYLANDRSLRTLLAANQNIGEPCKYNAAGVHHPYYGDLLKKLCGIFLQERNYKSTIQLSGNSPIYPDQQLTVIISASYLDTHPNTNLIEEVIESLKFTGLPTTTTIILSHDRLDPGVKNFEEKEKAYQKYLENLGEYVRTCPFKNVIISVAPKWGHLTRTLKYAVSQVKTKYMLVLQHDIHIRREIPVLKMVDLMENHKHVKHLRFNVRRNHPTFMWWDGYHKDGHCIFAEEEYAGVKLCVTPAWSDQNHLATKEYYENVVFPDCTNPDGELIWDFMENRLNGLCHHNHDRYGTYIYGEYGASRTSRHSDGRKSSPEADED